MTDQGYKMILRFNKFLSSFDHKWFDWCIDNTNIELACLTENILPSKGNFWILGEDGTLTKTRL